ncbi:MAG: elongation factor G [Candidatus Omnitrophota bacterium]
MSKKENNKRTFLVCGHAQSGKTSICESILFKCGAVSRLGKVDDNTSFSDYEDDEKERKSSINLSVMNAEYKGLNLEFIDVPGYLDFVGEMVSSSRACDFAVVVVDAVEGVGIGTEKAWEIAKKENLPCIFFINKLDKENTDYNRTLADINNFLAKKAISVSKIESSNVINLLKDKDKDPFAYGKIVESVVETDDALLEKYFEAGKLDEDEVGQALNKAIAGRQFFPVIGGAAVNEQGIDVLLDVIATAMFFSGNDRKRLATDKNGEQVSIEPDPDGPFCAQVFKTVIDPFVGQLTIFRIYSGSIKSNSEFYNSAKDQKEKFGQLFSLQAKQQIAKESLSAGDIGAVAKLKNTSTGDTLCSLSRILSMGSLEFPSPVYSASVKPKTRQDEDKISTVLARLTSEDPTCSVSRDAQTKELIISGMGELHIHIIIERMKRKYSADVELGTPKVPYFETVTKAIQVQHKYKKQTGGRGQYGDVSIILEPLGRGKNFEFVDKVVGGAIPRNYIPSVEKGVRKFMVEGPLVGCPIIDIRVTLFDGSYHAVDSSDIAFQIAASMAMKKAYEQAGAVLLEPIMNVEIVAPEDFMGQITGDINGRRGRIMGMEAKGKNQAVKAQVPLSEMFKYTSDLRSVTGGRGNYTMAFSHYEIVPQRILQGIVEAAKKAKQES